MKKLFFLALVLITSLASSANADLAFINEFHYDNDGGDTGEFVEFAVESGADLSTVEFFLVNGNGGATYDSIFANDASITAGDSNLSFSGVLYDLYVWEPTSIQNGGPDGIAVITSMGLQEFLSYEGVIANTDFGGGIIGGSTDIGVSEPGNTLIGSSLQLGADGLWTLTSGTNTQGAANFSTIPEPTSAVLLGFSGLGLCIVRRRS